jgi:hypothetical protein
VQLGKFNVEKRLSLFLEIGENNFSYSVSTQEFYAQMFSRKEVQSLVKSTFNIRLFHSIQYTITEIKIKGVYRVFLDLYRAFVPNHSF